MSHLTPDLISVLTAGRLAHLTTVEPDGRPQMSAVWVGVEGDEIVTANLHGGRKVHNVRRNPEVAFTMEAAGTSGPGLANYVIVRGTARVTEGGAPELLQRLAAAYLGPGIVFPAMPDPPEGFVIRITPTRIGGVGPWAS